MKPGRFNFELIQGDTFHYEPAWKVNNAYVNVTGYTAKMDVKIAPTSTSTITELSTENGRIAVGGADGTFTLDLTSAETAVLPAGNFIYDLNVISPGGVVTTLLTGGFTVITQVTA